jgi:hypothetical protein
LNKSAWKIKRLNTEIPYDLAAPLLGTHPKEVKAGTHTCLLRCTAELFTADKWWKHLDVQQPMNGFFKMWYILTMGYCSVIKMKY